MSMQNENIREQMREQLVVNDVTGLNPVPVWAMPKMACPHAGRHQALRATMSSSQPRRTEIDRCVRVRQGAYAGLP